MSTTGCDTRVTSLCLDWACFAFPQVTSTYNRSHALSFSIGAESFLGLMGVDSGKDCADKRVDVCNGDNRDAQYISSYPLVGLPTEK